METNLYTEGYISSALETSQTSLFKGALNRDHSKESDDELMKVCKEFETYFVEQVFKEMKKTVPQYSEFSSSSKQLLDYFEGNLYQEYAREMVEQNTGLGLAQTMYEQMKRNYAASDTDVEQAAEEIASAAQMTEV